MIYYGKDFYGGELKWCWMTDLDIHGTQFSPNECELKLVGYLNSYTPPHWFKSARVLAFHKEKNQKELLVEFYWVLEVNNHMTCLAHGYKQFREDGKTLDYDGISFSEPSWGKYDEYLHEWGGEDEILDNKFFPEDIKKILYKSLYGAEYE